LRRARVADYAATFDIEQPERFDRIHVVIRVLILIVLTLIGGAIGWLYGLVYLVIPVLAAVLISQKGQERYFAEASEGIVNWLRYIVAFQAYIFLLTDRLPNEKIEEFLYFDVKPEGEVSPGAALLRILLALPSAIVLALLSIRGALLGLIAAILILFEERYPESIYAFLRGLVRWSARLLAYLAGLVEKYPPFALDTDAQGLAGSSASHHSSSS
jgi:hypothetical protein